MNSLPSVQALYQLHYNVESGNPNTDSKYIANDSCDSISGNYIKASVDANAGQFTMSIPAKRTQFSYPIKRTEPMPETNTPLPIPHNFNAETSMLFKTTENGICHESRSAAGFAARLVANGAPQDLALAAKVLDAVLECQELRPGDVHYGNFRWMREDEVVEDLNAVEFVLENLIPMMLKHGFRLSAQMRERVHPIRIQQPYLYIGYHRCAQASHRSRSAPGDRNSSQDYAGKAGAECRPAYPSRYGQMGWPSQPSLSANSCG